MDGSGGLSWVIGATVAENLCSSHRRSWARLLSAFRFWCDGRGCADYGSRNVALTG